MYVFARPIRGCHRRRAVGGSSAEHGRASKLHAMSLVLDSAKCCLLNTICQDFCH